LLSDRYDDYSLICLFINLVSPMSEDVICRQWMQRTEVYGEGGSTV
jgi:hypothetical protein